uniref:Uncharacterized protein n=1 Tax=Solanum tuberosum TaxID=4113 RepID=M1DFZ0_SOLTU
MRAHRALAPPRRKISLRNAVMSRTLLSQNLIPNIFREQLRVADLFRDENAEIQKSIFTSLKSPFKFRPLRIQAYFSRHLELLSQVGNEYKKEQHKEGQ